MVEEAPAGSIDEHKVDRLARLGDTAQLMDSGSHSRRTSGTSMSGRHARCPPRRGYLMSVSILNIGRYIEMMTTPTITPTPIIISGSMIEVRAWTEASTSSS
jgi:hypothetical protein